MAPLIYVTRARVVRAALRRSPPWVTIEAYLLAIDHVCDADDADERHRKSDEDGDQPDAELLGHEGTIRRSHRCVRESMNSPHDHCRDHGMDGQARVAQWIEDVTTDHKIRVRLLPGALSRQVPRVLAGMLLRPREPATFRVRIGRRSPPRDTVGAPRLTREPL